jgi:hypothetical protein
MRTIVAAKNQSSQRHEDFADFEEVFSAPSLTVLGMIDQVVPTACAKWSRPLSQLLAAGLS